MADRETSPARCSRILSEQSNEVPLTSDYRHWEEVGDVKYRTINAVLILNLLALTAALRSAREQGGKKK
jgi:hypothetical protein